MFSTSLLGHIKPHVSLVKVTASILLMSVRHEHIKITELNSSLKTEQSIESIQSENIKL